MKKVIKSISLLSTVACTFLLAAAITFAGELPDRYRLIEGQKLTFNKIIPISASCEISGGDGNTINVSGGVDALAGSRYTADIKLFGIVPIKKVDVEVVDRMYVVPGGQVFGIKIFSQGVMVVGMTDVDGQNGMSNPAAEAGIQIGDIVLSINGKNVSSNAGVAGIIENSGGKAVKMKIKRKEITLNVTLHPVLSLIEGKYRAGMWVRDSSAGIGTMTFHSPSDGVFAGLGHSITDIDTGELVPVQSGEIVAAKVGSVEKGVPGKAGELCGSFISGKRLGSLLQNNENGVYGVMDKVDINQKLVQIATKQEVETGEAKIITTVDESGPKYFSCVIEKVQYNEKSGSQSMIIKITDEELLSKTGGIVQGMSGSPIIQNDKLIGAVTHVFVNDPERGYGIFAENMYDTTQDMMKYLSQKAG